MHPRFTLGEQRLSALRSRDPSKRRRKAFWCAIHNLLQYMAGVSRRTGGPPMQLRIAHVVAQCDKRCLCWLEAWTAVGIKQHHCAGQALDFVGEEKR
jgi:hypothetical protein